MDETTGLLELVADQGRPEQLDLLLGVLGRSSARADLLALADHWSVALPDLRTTILRASSDLDRLERRRGGSWKVEQVCTMPNLAALADLARARLGRVGSSRMAAVCRRVECADRDARRRKMVINFLSEEPSARVSLDFLRPRSHRAMAARISRGES